MKTTLREIDDVALETVTQAELAHFVENNAESYDFYGLPVVSFDGGEFAIADSDATAEQAAHAYIRETVWAFNADFLSSHMAGGKLTASQIEALRGDSCEDCNDAFLALIDEFDDFASDAISGDGMGHFLSSYDGEETEIGDFRVYRIN